MVETLASVGCSGEEIAKQVGCSRSTLYARFLDTIEKGHNNQKVSLRRKQFEVAMSGDRTMLIWLGKQYLEQSDKHEVDGLGALYQDPRLIGIPGGKSSKNGNNGRNGNGHISQLDGRGSGRSNGVSKSSDD